jgi:predicted RNase H-like HicB family nuclease
VKFTAIIEKTEEGWFVGQVKEKPAAISQGKTIIELKENLRYTLKLLMEINSKNPKSRKSKSKIGNCKL